MRRLAAVAVSVLVAAGVAGCGNGEGGSGNGHGGTGEHHHGGSGKPAFARSAADVEVDVTLRDFAIDMPPEVRGRKAFFEARNDGPSPHELELLDEDGREVGAIPPFPEGETHTLAVELEPGTYRAQCLVRVGERTHAELGMVTEFTVSESGAGP